MQEFSQVFQDLLRRFFSVFLLHSFSDLLHRFGCMMFSCGSPIFGVHFVTLAWALHMMTWQ